MLLVWGLVSPGRTASTRASRKEVSSDPKRADELVLVGVWGEAILLCVKDLRYL
jgi:hypothetical protein